MSGVRSGYGMNSFACHQVFIALIARCVIIVRRMRLAILMGLALFSPLLAHAELAEGSELAKQQAVLDRIYSDDDMVWTEACGELGRIARLARDGKGPPLSPAILMTLRRELVAGNPLHRRRAAYAL